MNLKSTCMIEYKLMLFYVWSIIKRCLNLFLFTITYTKNALIVISFDITL